MRFLLVQFYCQKDPSYMAWHLWKEQRQRKKAAHVFWAAYSAISKSEFVGSTIFWTLFCLDYLFLSLTQRAAVL